MRYIESFVRYLECEKNLSANTLQCYSRDIQTLEQYFERRGIDVYKRQIVESWLWRRGGW